MRIFSRIGVVSALSFVAGVGSLQPGASARGDDPKHTLTGATDGHVFSVKDARGRVLALHFLPPGDSPECVAFVREYLRQAPGVAGVVHVFARADNAADVKAWAAQFKGDAAVIHVDQDGALARELNLSSGLSPGGATLTFPATVVFDENGKELFRYVGASVHDHLPFVDFAKKVGQATRRSSLSDYNVPQDKPLAVEGYDLVAYFAQNKAVKGAPEWSSAFHGVTYQFASSEHRVLFANNPERYLPTYGGWCASAMGAKGTKVEIDPTNFKVKDGRLFLFYKSLFGDALKDWNKNEKDWEPAADTNWKKLTGEDPVKPVK